MDGDVPSVVMPRVGPQCGLECLYGSVDVFVDSFMSRERMCVCARLVKLSCASDTVFIAAPSRVPKCNIIANL